MAGEKLYRYRDTYLTETAVQQLLKRVKEKGFTAWVEDNLLLVCAPMGMFEVVGDASQCGGGT